MSKPEVKKELELDKYEFFVRKKVSITVKQFKKHFNLCDTRLRIVLEQFRKGYYVFVSTNNLLVWSYCSPRLKKSLLKKKPGLKKELIKELIGGQFESCDFINKQLLLGILRQEIGFGERCWNGLQDGIIIDEYCKKKEFEKHVKDDLFKEISKKFYDLHNCRNSPAITIKEFMKYLNKLEKRLELKP